MGSVQQLVRLGSTAQCSAGQLPFNATQRSEVASLRSVLSCKRCAQSEISESVRLDPDLAPPGHHVVHAYTPATEPWEDWADLDETLSTKPRVDLLHVLFCRWLWPLWHCGPRSSSEYKKKKQEARDFLYSAVAKQVPDLEDCHFCMGFTVAATLCRGGVLEQEG